MTLPRGRSLGPDQIEALIGAGGMGEVYRARDEHLNRLVAIKVLADPLVNPARRAVRARSRRDRASRSAIARMMPASEGMPKAHAAAARAIDLDPLIFDPVRDDPRFHELLVDSGLVS